ncbi:hypothetical protein NPX13_g1975 [Xylaria arbuscula]|uniref:Uncharacterized protein n=1 Tax=Xylaria arbuscula TaxID=114810 RepID=A0A9W8TQU3_9PEZI|nr:hypothetical protein NPX13_g1975 [Xylaria arbuscula]
MKSGATVHIRQSNNINTGLESSNLSRCNNTVGRLLRAGQWATDYWIWELISWLISSVLLAGVILTLSLHQNQPLPEWPFGITINALISFLSSLSTSALIGVVASIIGQGGWATLTSAKRPLVQLEMSLQSVGPVIVIASLATAPFVQQITNVELTNDAVDTATILALRNYPNLRMENQFSQPLSYGDVPNLVTAAFYGGLYFPGNLTDPLNRSSLQHRPICSTGNCAFPKFDSLAVCSACANITNQLVTSRNSSGARWSLPNGFVLTEEESMPVISTTGAFDPLILHAGLPIANITAIQPCQDTDGTICSSIAQECMLHWCLNRYSSSVVQGILHEEVTDTVKYGYTINADRLSDELYIFQTNSSFAHTTVAETYSTLNISRWGSDQLGRLIAQTLTVQVFRLSESTKTDAFEVVDGSNLVFPGVPLNMSPMFEAMALSLTAAVRSYRHDETTLQLVKGQAFKEVPLLRVRWGWIALPIALQIASLLLLCYVALRTSRQRLPVWKLSVLATVFFGVRIREHIADPVPIQLMDMSVVASELDHRAMKTGLET